MSKKSKPSRYKKRNKRAIKYGPLREVIDDDETSGEEILSCLHTISIGLPINGYDGRIFRRCIQCLNLGS